MRLPDDAKGLRFRIQPSDVITAQFKALGASPLKTSFAEVYQALQSGTVDGQENTWSNIYSQKFHELQKYITNTDHGVVDYMVVTNSGFWAGLPADLRGQLEKIMAEVTDRVNDSADAQNAADMQRILDSGRSEIVRLTPEQKSKWREVMKPLYAKFEESIGKDVIDAALAVNKAKIN